MALICMKRLTLILLVLLPCMGLEAQIRIVPRAQLDSIARPTAVAAGAMCFECGEVCSFGTIDELSGAWRRRVVWRNTTSEPIVITHVKSSCGCLRAETVRGAVAAGAEGWIELCYLPRGHAGAVEQRLLIYTPLSAERPTAVLRVVGQVTASADRSDDYPYTRGALRLRRDGVTFTGRGVQQERIACLNGGTTSLTLRADTLLTSAGLTMQCVPQILAAGEEGSLIVSYDPAKRVHPERLLKLYIDGLPLAPRQRMVEVNIVE